MKIRMRTQYAGPLGAFRPGETADLPDTEAKALIEGGYATDPSKEVPKAKTPPKPGGRNGKAGNKASETATTQTGEQATAQAGEQATAQAGETAGATGQAGN